MASYTLRPLNPDSEREMNTVAVFSMMTLWESRPELRIDPDQIPDFGFEASKKINKAGLRNPNQRYLIALDGDAQIVGHSIIGLRTGEGDDRYGYFWSRYVLPEHRRQGIASRFMDEALSWFKEKGVKRAEVHIHLSNQALRKVFVRMGFRPIDRRTGRWEYVVLSKKL